MTSPSKRKGDGHERQCAEVLKQFGFDVVRVGAQPGMRTDAYDLVISKDQIKMTVECKRRRAGWIEIYNWISRVTLLLLRSDRQETLVVIRLSDFLKLVSEKNADSA